MGVKAVLDMDMATLGQGLRRAFAWWRGELAGLLPARLRTALDGPQLVLTLDGDRPVLHRRTAAGWRVVAAPRRALFGKALLALPASAVLVGEFDYPVPSAGELRRMIALDVNRLTPFRAEEVVFDVALLGPPPAKGVVRRVALAVAHRRVLAELLARLAKDGLVPRGLVLLDDGAGTPRFHFALSALADQPAADPGPGWRLLPWAVPALLAANLALLVLRDQNATDSLREAVESQRLQVTLVERLRSSIEREDQRRRALLERQRRQSPLALLAALTEALPDQSWVTGLEWNGGTLHLRGAAPPDLDVAARLAATGLLSEVRPADDDDAGTEGFDLVAKAAPP